MDLTGRGFLTGVSLRSDEDSIGFRTGIGIASRKTIADWPRADSAGLLHAFETLVNAHVNSRVIGILIGIRFLKINEYP